jgi:AcrR family transcriptional regulator
MTVTDSGGKRKRAYSSPLRDAEAAERREKIRVSAARLFVRNGYLATGMGDIATDAGVSERTVFNAFPSKAALLSECIRVAVRGDAGAVPMLAREHWRAIFDAPAQRMIGLFADASADLYSRAAPLLAVGEAAASADPLLARERDRGHAATLADLREVARAMKRKGALRRGVSAERAAEAMYALAANESVYLRLVAACGWSPSAYARALERALLGAIGSATHDQNGGR